MGNEYSIGIDGNTIQNTLRENSLITFKSTPSTYIQSIETIEISGNAAKNAPMVIDRFEISEIKKIKADVTNNLISFQYMSTLPFILCE